MGSLLFVVLFVVYLAPGLLALLLFRAPERASTWIALSAPVAVGIQIATECVLKVFANPLTGEVRILATVAVSILLFVAVVGMRRRAPVRTRDDVRVVVCVVLVPLAFALAFGGAVFRRELTSDGVESLEMARQLSTHVLPRWPVESGLKGFGQGLIALAFPNAWFTSLGSDDWLPRLTFLMFLGVIVAQVIALVEARRERNPGSIAVAAIALSIMATGATLGLNTSFDPYFADPANPAGAEMMAVAMMLAAFIALLKRRTTLFLLSTVLAHATLPSGLLFLVILGAAMYAITRDRGHAMRTGAAVALCLLITVLYEKVYVPNVLPPGASMDAGSESLASRMRLLIFTDVGRLVFLVIPCGIVPALFLCAWKRQDPVSRMIAVTAGALFLFFFVLATYSPHYFAPVMVLAIVPYWRWARSRRAEWIGFGGAAAGLLLSLPWSHDVPQPYRAVGQSIRIDGTYGSLTDVTVPAALLQRLAYLPWEDVDPAQKFVASGLQLAEYSSSWNPSGGNADADWVVQAEAAPPLAGYQPVVSQAGWTLFARPGVSIESVRDRGYPTDFPAPWYRVPREALFRGLTEKSGRYDLDLRKIFR